MARDVEHLLFFCHPYAFFGEMSLNVLSPFSTELFVLLLLSVLTAYTSDSNVKKYL